MESEKRPRHYAAEIIDTPDRETRAAMLERVPEHLQAMTKTHVINAFMKKNKK